MGMSIGILIHNMILLLICLIFFRTVPVIAGVLIGAAAADAGQHVGMRLVNQIRVRMQLAHLL